MAGSLGLGIGFEEHHVENVAVLMDGWEAEVCTDGTWDPDCECCCQIIPPDTTGWQPDPDWTLMWGVDAYGNIYPESYLVYNTDGYWEAGTYPHVIPVSVVYCQELTPGPGSLSDCLDC